VSRIPQDGDFLRNVTPAFEDLRLITGKPYTPGANRWFRSSNIVDLMAHKRDRGLVEWNVRDPWAGLTVEDLRMPARQQPRYDRAWSPNVVALAAWRKVIWPGPAPTPPRSAA
jgi:hypothetical protein